MTETTTQTITIRHRVTNPLSKLALEWTDLWLTNVKAAFAK